jgi:hypothetical protein
MKVVRLSALGTGRFYPLPRPTALLSPSSVGKPDVATAVIVAPDNGHKYPKHGEPFLNDK